MQKKWFALLKNNSLLTAFLFLGLLAFLSSNREGPLPESKASGPKENSADTYIPRGFVLVPLEIANSESLGSLLSDVGGVVDLYLASSGTNETKRSNNKVGSKLKLLRAPLNPHQYAVLVRESEGSRLLSYPGPFVAVVQNPTATGAELTTSGSKKIVVEYQK